MDEIDDPSGYLDGCAPDCPYCTATYDPDFDYGMPEVNNGVDIFMDLFGAPAMLDYEDDAVALVEPDPDEAIIKGLPLYAMGFMNAETKMSSRKAAMYSEKKGEVFGYFRDDKRHRASAAALNAKDVTLRTHRNGR
jgi:hypothetical protein